MKFVSSFQPLNFWAQGPWMFFNMGLQFMQTWQKECFSRLQMIPLTAVSPFSASLPTTVASDAPVAEKPIAAPAEIQSLLNEVAARQGRETPLLGCLQNVKVVGGPETDVAVNAPAKPVAAKKPVAQTKTTTKMPKAVAPAPVAMSVAPPVVEAKVEKVAASLETTPEFDEEVSPAPATSSVTSMLAMQAKSLAKAVKTAPAPVVAGKSTAKAPAKAVAKTAVQSADKAAAKSVAKPAAAAKPAAKPRSATSKKS